MAEGEAVVAETAREAGEGAPAHGVAAEGATRSRADSGERPTRPLTPPRASLLSKPRQMKRVGGVGGEEKFFGRFFFL